MVKNIILQSALFFLFFMTEARTNEMLLDKARQARTKTEMAFNLCKEHALEEHRALISAYWIRSGDFVIDVGAHLGHYSAYYSKLVGKNGLVLAYEASPPIYGCMINRLKSLGIENVSTRDKAVSDTSNIPVLMKIYSRDMGAQSSTLEPLHWNKERMPGETEIVEVKTEKLDDLLNNNNFPVVRFIKIYVEGHEHAVIKGARQLLLTQRPLVIFEYGYQKGYWEPDTIRQMEELDYICYDCNSNLRVRPGYGKLAVPYVLTDLLAIPSEYTKQIVPLLPYLY